MTSFYMDKTDIYSTTYAPSGTSFPTQTLYPNADTISLKTETVMSLAFMVLILSHNACLLIPNKLAYSAFVSPDFWYMLYTISLLFMISPMLTQYQKVIVLSRSFLPFRVKSEFGGRGGTNRTLVPFPLRWYSLHQICILFNNQKSLHICKDSRRLFTISLHLFSLPEALHTFGQHLPALFHRQATA